MIAKLRTKEDQRIISRPPFGGAGEKEKRMARAIKPQKGVSYAINR
jgi:hypothetical protein